MLRPAQPKNRWQMPEDLREAIVLCEWEERSVAEVALILEATPKAIESRLYRARQNLREQLKTWLSQTHQPT